MEDQSYDADDIDDSFPEGTENGDPMPKKRRRRAVLSCTACKLRKIKCSRTFPCTACVGRGSADTCHWADVVTQPPPTRYLPESAFDAYRASVEDRLARIEESLNIKSLHLHQHTPTPPVPTPVSLNCTSQQSGRTSPEQNSRGVHVPAVLHEDAAENAALALEDLAVSSTTRGFDQAITQSGSSLEQFARESILDMQWTSPYGQLPRLASLLSCTPGKLVEAIEQTIPAARARPVIDHFIMQFSWATYAVHPPTFMRECQAYWNYLPTPNRACIDPAWLAIYACVLAFGSRFRTMTSDDSSEEMYHIAKACLDLARAERKPQVRVLQSLVILMWLEMPDPSASVYHGMAIKTAQLLKFDQLGSDPSFMPPLDRTLPSNTLLARELAVRIWWQVVGFDWLLSYAAGRKYLIQAGSFTTARPRNFSDADIEEGPVLREPRALGSGGEGEIIAVKSVISDYVRRLADLGPVSAHENIDEYYENLVDLDTKSQEGSAQLHACGDHAKKHTQFGYRWILTGLTFETRRLRLFRVFSLRAYKDAKYSYAIKAVVDSAFKILELARVVTTINIPQNAQRFMYADILPAVLTLYTDVFHDIDTGVEIEVAAKLSRMSAAGNAFTQAEASSSSAIKEIGLKGRLMLTALSEHVAERRQRRNCGQPPEDFAEVFKRTAIRVSKEASFTLSMGSFIRTSAPNTPLSDPINKEMYALMGNLGFLPDSMQQTSMPPLQTGYTMDLPNWATFDPTTDWWNAALQDVPMATEYGSYIHGSEPAW